jgi:hypothetical protein
VSAASVSRLLNGTRTQGPPVRYGYALEAYIEVSVRRWVWLKVLYPTQSGVSAYKPRSASDWSDLKPRCVNRSTGALLATARA